jgi:hypothetical protein
LIDGSDCPWYTTGDALIDHGDSPWSTTGHMPWSTTGYALLYHGRCSRSITVADGQCSLSLMGCALLYQRQPMSDALV